MAPESVIESNAAQSRFYETHDRTEDARPDDDDLTPADEAATMWERKFILGGYSDCE